MTNQEIFTKVSEHLLSQNETCMENSVCMYRYNGLACSVGCLIPDDLYDPEMEGVSVRSLIKNHLEIKEHFDLQAKGLALLERLQDIHDTQSPESWAGHLEIIRKQYEL